MTELLDIAGAPGVLLLAIAIFGIAPGFVLRLTVLLYPKDNERRKELIAELYAMPRLQRPFWVGEQIETALFEGILARRIESQEKRKSKKSKEANEEKAEEGLPIVAAVFSATGEGKTEAALQSAREVYRYGTAEIEHGQYRIKPRSEHEASKLFIAEGKIGELKDYSADK